MRIDTRLGNGAEAGGMTEQNNQANLVGGHLLVRWLGLPVVVVATLGDIIVMCWFCQSFIQGTISDSS